MPSIAAVRFVPLPTPRPVRFHGTRVLFSDGVEAQCARSIGSGANFGHAVPEIATAVGRVLDEGAVVEAGAAGWHLGQAVGLPDVRSVRFATPAQVRAVLGTATVVGRLDVSADSVIVQRTLNVLGHGGALVLAGPADGLHAASVALIRAWQAAGGVLVADESSSAWFRLGPRFAHRDWPLEPDAVLLGRSITNGISDLGALVLSAHAERALEGVTVLPQTAWDDSIGAAASVAVCRLGASTPDPAPAAALRDGMLRLADHRHVTRVTGSAWWYRIDLVTEGSAVRAVEAVRQEGAWVEGTGSTLTVGPPVVSSTADVARLVEALDAGIERAGIERAGIP